MYFNVCFYFGHVQNRNASNYKTLPIIGVFQLALNDSLPACAVDKFLSTQR